jgi:sulfite reductase (NADPH) hemoprotein beta-component
MTLKAVTANRLGDGQVVYMTATGRWSEWLDDATVADAPDGEAALLSVAQRAVETRLVVGPYAMAVTRVQGRLRPTSQREIIRARGPSVRPDLGKQAVGR